MGLRITSSTEGRARPLVLLAITAPLMRTAAEECLSACGFAARNGHADAAAVIESAVRELPDAAVIDKDLRGGGIAAATEVSSAAPSVAMVILAERPTEADVLDAIHAGALGCLPKDVSIEGLARALRGVLAGEPALPRSLMSAVLEEIRDVRSHLLFAHAHEELPDLTLRELEVLRLLAYGSSTMDIACALSISPITVRRHCAAICRKLHAPDRATAVERVKRSRWPRAPISTNIPPKDRC
jgi:DNA-binding NarL/FixJ family response regulator